MPADRRRKTKTPEDVPEAGDPDRKRVLNVLAQRRYRQRRREKIAALEAQTKNLTSPQPVELLQDGGAQIAPQHANSSSSESLPDESGVIEEVFRNLDDVGFPAMDFGQDPLDIQLLEDFNICALPSPIPASTISSSRGSSSPSSTASSPPFNFPLTSDGAQLEVPALSAIRAFYTIGTALDILAHVWNPGYQHILPVAPSPNLPPNLHPTPAQRSIPHHPFLDALPWPGVREKLICIFSLPSALRPPIAQEDEEEASNGKAIMRLVQDLDDFTDGVRVHANVAGWGEGNEMMEEAWEVGELFYRNWWFCLDWKTIDLTNRRRKERGLRALKF